jgi:L-iditol 2-dehydrogenase
VKAAVFIGVDRLEVREVDRPKLERAGAVVRVRACGICGSDIRNLHTGPRADVPNQIMGHEISGDVVEVGNGVRTLAAGDRVAIAPDVVCGTCYYCSRNLGNLCVSHRMIGTHWPGGFAEYLSLPEEVLLHGIVHRLADALSYDAGALAEPAASVIAAQEAASVGQGDRVVIIGDGPIGCLHIEVARFRGASFVAMVGKRRLGAAHRFEPDLSIDARTEDPVEAVRRATDGIGADVVICANPNATTHEQAVEMSRKRGSIVLFGGLPRSSPMTTLNGNTVHYNELRVIGAFSYRKETHEQALRLIEGGAIHPEKYVDRVVALAEIGEGLRAAESREALKVIVRP